MYVLFTPVWLVIMYIQSVVESVQCNVDCVVRITQSLMKHILCISGYVVGNYGAYSMNIYDKSATQILVTNWLPGLVGCFGTIRNLYLTA